MNDALARAGARWDDDPSAGEWILPLLGDPGAAVEAHVPRGYDAYAVVPYPLDEDGAVRVRAADDRLEALLDVLAPHTGDQPVHVGLWEGWGFLYDHGGDPATAPGMAALVASDERPRWWQRGRRAAAVRDELRAVQSEVSAALAGMRLERPATEPLDTPYMARFLWTGPLRSATALRQFGEPPSLVWPHDRSWFLAVPEYTREMAVGGSCELVGTVLSTPGMDARPADLSTVLDIDD
ncbi:hypothetical protein GCM10009809_26050 [Isoptericola hypogeus]|uniref:Uncharacterized protein n=1 Tax=Isoptericola hypogeus TaxID=300179 RepID=A0ABN2JJQ6_9MICO